MAWFSDYLVCRLLWLQFVNVEMNLKSTESWTGLITFILLWYFLFIGFWLLRFDISAVGYVHIISSFTFVMPVAYIKAILEFRYFSSDVI